MTIDMGLVEHRKSASLPCAGMVPAIGPAKKSGSCVAGAVRPNDDAFQKLLTGLSFSAFTSAGFSLMRLLMVVLSLLASLALARTEPGAEFSDDERINPERLEHEAAAEAAGQALDHDAEAAPAWEWLRAPGFDTLVCPFRDRIDYEPGQVECGLIRVPENREVAGSRTIELNFIRIRASGEDAKGKPVETRSDPVVYLTGGPGVHAEVYVRRFMDHGLVRQRDLIILEQRGIGNSGDFCPFFGQLNRADQIHPDWHESQMASLRVAAQCIEDARARGVDVTGYHSFENARDVKALRLALGLEDWNVWGISYGSVLGQAYMQVDAEGIRAVVLDAIVPLDLKDLMRIAHWHERNLAMLFAACADQRRCGRVHDGLEARYRAAIAALTERPMGLDVTADERFPTGRAYVFQDLPVGLPFMLLYEESNHPAIPAIIDGLTRAVEKRDQTLFRAIALSNMGRVGFSGGMSTAVRCLDGYASAAAENAEREFRDHPLLAQAFGSRLAIAEADRLCREGGLAPRDPAQFQLVQSDLPVLVANGAWDPITPVPLAEYIMPGFSNGRLAVFPHAGHGPTRSLDCGGDFMNAFFDDPAAPLDQDCIDKGGTAARYIAPYFRTAAVRRGLVIADESRRRLVGHATWAGVSAALSFVGAMMLLVSWCLRVINGQRLRYAFGTRFVVFLAAVASAAYAAGLAAAAYATAQVTEAMLLFGFLPWAMWFAWLAPLSVLLALLGLLMVWKQRKRLYPGSWLGLVPVCLAAISLAAAGLYWDLWPI